MYGPPTDGSGGGVIASVTDIELWVPVGMFTVRTSNDIFQALCKSELESMERSMVESGEKGSLTISTRRQT